MTFLQQLRAHHPEPLIVIWDNGPAHGGAPLRAYLTTPDLRLRLVRLPAYSPDFNPDEPVWGWVRADSDRQHVLRNHSQSPRESGRVLPWPGRSD